eukprot:s1495_g4.t1
MALVPGDGDAPDAPLDPVPVYENTDLNGLADDWEGDARVRRPALKAGGVLQWPDPKKMGVVNFAAIKLNSEVLTHDPTLRQLFDILAEFFTVKAGTRTRAWEPAEEADPYGDFEQDEDGNVETEEHSGGDNNFPNQEPMEEPMDESGDSCDGPGESHDVGGEAGKPEHPVTPTKNTPKSDDDPLDEFMAWKMGGESMVKPTPSPGNPWTNSKHSVKDGQDQITEIDDELERLELLISICGAYPAEGETLPMDLSPMAAEVRMASGGTTVENQDPKVDNETIPATQPDPEESEVFTEQDPPDQKMPPPAKVELSRLDQIGAFPKPKAKAKGKAKAKAAASKSKPRAKAQAKKKAQKATPKAKAKAKVERKRKGKDEDEAKVEGEGDVGTPSKAAKKKKTTKKTDKEPQPPKVKALKASFARRYCPKTDPGKTWHLAVRENFEIHIAPRVKHASKAEDTGVCFIDRHGFTSMLLALLTICARGTVLIENPDNSIINQHERTYTPSFAAAVLQARRTLRKTRGPLPEALVETLPDEVGGPTSSTDSRDGAVEPSPKDDDVIITGGKGGTPEPTEPTEPLPTKPLDEDGKSLHPKTKEGDVSLQTPVQKDPKSPIELGSDSEDEDNYQPESPPDPPQISKAAAGARLRRLFTPRSDGSYQVPQEAVQMYKDLDQRGNLEKMFERCAYSPVTWKMIGL